MGVPYSQVVPKGGWWLHVLREVTEHELRMVAAVIGLTYDRVLSPTEASWEVKTGAMPRVAFIRLGSIAAYIFASMAVRERGPGGRARRADRNDPASVVDVPSIADFAMNDLSVPRYIVAALAAKAVALKTQAAIARLERVRLQCATPTAMILAHGTFGSGAAAALVYADGLGIGWMAQDRIKATPAGLKSLQFYESMLLPAFGYRAVVLSGAPAADMPSPQVEMRLCALCAVSRAVVQFASISFLSGNKRSIPTACYLCHDSAGVQSQSGDRVSGVTHGCCAECGMVKRAANFSVKQWKQARISRRCDSCVQTGLQADRVQGRSAKRHARHTNCKLVSEPLLGSPDSISEWGAAAASKCSCGLQPCLLVRVRLDACRRLLPADAPLPPRAVRLDWGVVVDDEPSAPSTEGFKRPRGRGPSTADGKSRKTWDASTGTWIDPALRTSVPRIGLQTPNSNSNDHMDDAFVNATVLGQLQPEHVALTTAVVVSPDEGPEEVQTVRAAGEIDSDYSDEEFSDDEFAELAVPKQIVASSTSDGGAAIVVRENMSAELDVGDERPQEVVGDEWPQEIVCECGLQPCLARRHQLHREGRVRPSETAGGEWGTVLPVEEVSWQTRTRTQIDVRGGTW